jgi:hypothetical protein
VAAHTSSPGADPARWWSPLAGVALFAIAVAPLVGLLVRVWTQGGHISGGTGLLVLDQMQYYNWLRQAGEHVLIGNLYEIEAGPRTFLHPGLLISGVLERLGVHFIAAYLLWLPLAVMALYLGASAWSARFLPAGRDRLAAVVLALLFASPIAALVGWSGVGGERVQFYFDFLGGELTPSNWLWGYIFTALAVALMPLGLLAYERGAHGWAAGAALVVSWLQPWQGATYLLVLWVAERLRIPLRLVAVGAAGTLPLLYYFVLSQTDRAWELAGEANDFTPWPWWVTIVGLSILAVPAATGWRNAPGGFAGRALRAWPLAALVVFLQPFGTFPAHAWQGVVLPLAVLAMLGIGRRASTPALVAALLVLTLPGTLYRLDQLRGAVNVGRQPFFLTDGERDALRHLEQDARAGGVLAPIYSGLLIPAYTQRPTWVGAGSWTPDFYSRVRRADRLFNGLMSPLAARELVRESGARFLLVDCHGRADIAPLVEGVAVLDRRFGCASVWEVR